MYFFLSIVLKTYQAYQRIGAITSELHDGGLDASGAHDQDPDTFKAAHRSMQATKVSIKAARKAAGGGAAGDAAAQVRRKREEKKRRVIIPVYFFCSITSCLQFRAFFLLFRTSSI